MTRERCAHGILWINACGECGRHSKAMGGSAPSRQFTKEDEAVFTKLFVTIMLRTPGAAIKWLRVTAESDRRDAVMMLDNVKHHVSAVVQAPTGEWAYFIHGTVASGRWVLEL